MKRTAFYHWRIVSETTGKVITTKWLMDEKTALARHPGAERIEPPAEWRYLPEPGDETNHNRAKGHGEA